MFICPLCNSLYEISLECPVCKARLEDAGILENYFGPYSPYLGEELADLADGVGEMECVHLFSCPCCGYEERYTARA